MLSSLIVVTALASSSTLVQAKCLCYFYNDDIKVELVSSASPEEKWFKDYSYIDDNGEAPENGRTAVIHSIGNKVKRSSIYCNDTSVTSISDCENRDITLLSIRTSSIPLVPGTIRGFTNLTRLHIEYFENPKLSKTFLSGQKNLPVFQIHSTSLEYVDKDWFKYAPNIITLVLSSNKIRSLAPETFCYLTRLESLHLNKNLLTTLPSTLFESTRSTIKHLYLHDNRWHCDSELFEIMKVINNYNVEISSPSYCSYPVQLKGLDLNFLLYGYDNRC